MPQTWFTSDTHFGHRAILKYCPLRGGLWETVEEMNEGLIAEWNHRVAPEDEVWHLGDFALYMKRHEIEDLLARLNGVKHLVLGNHDQKPTRKARGWASVQKEKLLELDGAILLLSHRPRKAGEGCLLNLHGHLHGRLGTGLPHRIDVGIDAPGTDGGPIPWEGIRAVLETWGAEGTCLFLGADR